MTFTLVPREEWGALPPTGDGQPLPSPIFKVITTKTGTPPCNSDEECKEHIRKIQKYHMDRGMEDIPYSFIMTPDCKLYEGRGWKRVVPTPPERPELKNKSIVIAHVGDFPEGETTFRNMIRATIDFIDHGIMNDRRIDWDVSMAEIGPWIKNDELHLTA